MWPTGGISIEPPKKQHWFYTSTGHVLHLVKEAPNYWYGTRLVATCGERGLFLHRYRDHLPRRCPTCCQVAGVPQGIGRL